MKKLIMLPAIAVAIAAWTAGAAQAAPVSYAGGTYSQDFNGLPTNTTNPFQLFTNTAVNGPFLASNITNASNLTGWQFGNYGGSSPDSEFRSQDGSLSGSSGRGVISYGTNGSTERALGALVTSNNIGQFGLTIINNTATTFDNFTLSYVGEQWRRGDITTPPNDKLTFSYGLGGAINVGGLTTHAPLSFASPNLQGAPLNVALNGNLAGNQTAISSTVNFTWAPGQTLVLKWAAGDITGQDDGLGIDNLSFTAGVVPEPASICLAMFGVAALVGCGLRDRGRSHRVRG